MTNKERAIISWTQEYRKHQFKDCVPTQEGFYQRGYVNGANEKDQQFKEAINSTLDYFDRGREAGFVSENSYNDMKYFASKVINKLFGEE